MTASGWMKMETSPAAAPFRNHSLMKHNPGRIWVFRCNSRTSIALKSSQMSCSGYRPLRDICPLRGSVRPDDDIAQPLTPTRTQPPPSSQQSMLDPESLMNRLWQASLEHLGAREFCQLPGVHVWRTNSRLGPSGSSTARLLRANP